MRLYDLAVKLLESDNDDYFVNTVNYGSYGGTYYVEIRDREGRTFTETITTNEGQDLKKLSDDYYKRKSERDKNKFKSQIMKDLGLTNE